MAPWVGRGSRRPGGVECDLYRASWRVQHKISMPSKALPISSIYENDDKKAAVVIEKPALVLAGAAAIGQQRFPKGGANLTAVNRLLVM